MPGVLGALLAYLGGWLAGLTLDGGTHFDERSISYQRMLVPCGLLALVASVLGFYRHRIAIALLLLSGLLLGMSPLLQTIFVGAIFYDPDVAAQR